MKVTREIIIKLHAQITDAFLASKIPGEVELKRFEEDATLYLSFWAADLNMNSQYIFEGTTSVENALAITGKIINFLQGKRKTPR